MNLQTCFDKLSLRYHSFQLPEDFQALIFSKLDLLDNKKVNLPGSIEFSVIAVPFYAAVIVCFFG